MALIRLSFNAISEIHDDPDVDVAQTRKGELDLPNGLEASPITINDLAIQQAKCHLLSQGREGYVATFSYGVKEPGGCEPLHKSPASKPKKLVPRFLLKC